MQLTPNYRLMKPDGTDPVNVQDLNSNMDALDDELIKKLDKTGDASNVVTKFSQATSRNNLTSGEKLSLSLGKIAKWFADMKTVAFSGKYTDLTERPTIPAGGIADASKIIDNVDDISALTQSGYIMGGLAGKQLISDLTALWEAVYPPIFYYIKDSLRIVPGFGLEPRGNQSNTPGMDADYTSGIQELKEGHNKLQITVSYFTSTNSAQGFSFGIAVKADGVEIASGLSMPTTGIMHIVDLPSNATNFEILFKIRANSCSVTWGFSDIHTFKQ